MPRNTTAHNTGAAAIRLALGLALVISAACWAQPSPQGDSAEFFRSVVGEWIGICEQSTDGEQADNKYFRAVIRQIDDKSFNGEFTYYRYDEATRSPLHIGDATILSTIEPDGTVRNEITGRGTMLVDERPKPQEHEIVEVLSRADDGSLTGRMDGRISVGDLPFGLGKNGRIYDGRSTWSLDDGVLTIHQSLRAGFRVLFFSKCFTVVAHSTARRGSDVVSLMTEKTRIAAQPAGHAPKGS